MVFIVGQTEQASEKADLLQQLGQVCFFFFVYSRLRIKSFFLVFRRTKT
jgi:hypothetical protein